MVKRFLYLLQISRPIFWAGPVFVYIATVFVMGEWNFISFWGLFFLTFPMGLIVYGLNDIADRKSDANNPRKGGVEGAIVKKGQVKFLSGAILIVTLISLLPFFIYKEIFVLIPIGFILFYAWAYSFEPLRFKTKPIFDSISSAFWMYSMFLLGYSIYVPSVTNLFDTPSFVLYLCLGAFNAHALATLFDYEVDRKQGDTTIGGLLTKRGTAFLCMSVFLFILIYMEPLNTAFYLYLLLSVFLCLVMSILPLKKVVYYCTWTVILTFPIACLYTLLFDFRYLQIILTM